MIRKARGDAEAEMVIGTDAVAGAHGHNTDEIVARVRQGGQKPMDAIVSATSLAAQSMRLEGRSARSRRATKRTSSPSTAIRRATSPP